MSDGMCRSAPSKLASASAKRLSRMSSAPRLFPRLNAVAGSISSSFTELYSSSACALSPALNSSLARSTLCRDTTIIALCRAVFAVMSSASSASTARNSGSAEATSPRRMKQSPFRFVRARASSVAGGAAIDSCPRRSMHSPYFSASKSSRASEAVADILRLAPKIGRGAGFPAAFGAAGEATPAGAAAAASQKKAA